MILLDDFLAHSVLLRRSEVVIHVEGFCRWSQFFFRMSVTIEAPFHRQGLSLVCERHFINPPVACRAADSLFHVNAVVEIDKVGEVVYASPPDRLVVSETLAHLDESGTIFPNLRMASHARVSWWNVRKCRGFDSCVTESAIDTKLAGMMGVTERNGLIDADVDLGLIGRPHEQVAQY